MSRSHEPPYLDPLPALSRAERNVMVQEAYESYEQLFKAIRIARSGSDAHATALGGVSGKTTGTVMMCTTTTITGTLEEVADLYTAPDSHFVLDFAESRRLYELESPSKESPMRCVGLRYSRWASISSLVTDRDLVYLEVMDEFVDKKTGHRGWARCTKSIEHRACPPSQHPNGPLRAELFVMGLVVRETATFGVLELITLVHADVRKRIPSWITRTVLKSRKKNAQALSHVLKVKRRVREGGSNGSGGGGSQIGDFTGRSHASSEEEAKDPRACKGCMDRVSRWSRSYKCRMCHELICKGCATMTYVDTDTKQLRNRICAECSFAGTEEDQSDDDSVDFELVDAHDYAAAQRLEKENAERNVQHQHHPERVRKTRDQSKEKERRHRKHKKHSEDTGESRERTYSQLSVEEKTFPNSNVTMSPNDPTASDDLASTMTRLRQLNNTNPQRTETTADSATAPPALHRHHSAGKRTEAPPTLHRQQSAGSSRSLRGTRNSRGPSQENVRVESTGINSRQRPASSKSRSASRKMSSPVIRAEPVPAPTAAAPAMIDLSYLQTFAAAKPPGGPKPTPAHQVSV